MRLGRLTAVCSATAAITMGCGPRQAPEAPPPAYMQQSNANVVFDGEVLKHWSSTVPAAPLDERTIVVRVDSVLRSPDLLGQLSGREVTVLVAEMPPPAIGDRVTFFGATWLVGEELAVREVGRVSGLINEDLQRQVEVALQMEQDSILAARLRGADFVVLGRVAQESDSVITAPVDREHDPMWREAMVAVDEMLKGERLSSITLRFPTSQDVMWYQAPRYEVGQRGIWILRSLAGTRAYTALDRQDYQPISQLDRIRRLLGSER
jgi:hypothetical protein